MSGVVSIPVIHPRAGVTVRVDVDAWTEWLAAGRDTRWHWHPDGPRFQDRDGQMRPVADAILGEPAYFVTGDFWDLTRSNLRPRA